MKKKVIALALCLVLVAIGVINSTLAYFTAEDEVRNVFTMGDVDIELIECELDRVNGGQGRVDRPDPLQWDKNDPSSCIATPGVDLGGDGCFSDEQIRERAASYEQGYFNLHSQLMEPGCYLRKCPYIDNVGPSPAYVRLRVYKPENQYICVHVNLRMDAEKVVVEDLDSQEENGKLYYVTQYTFKEPLEPGELTYWNPVCAVYIDKDATHEDFIENGFDVIFQADAIQTKGFESAAEAFNAFGNPPVVSEEPIVSEEPSQEEPEPSEEPSQEEPEPSEEPSQEEPEPSEEPSQEEPEPSEEPSQEEPGPSEEPSQEEPGPSEEPSQEEPEPSEEPSQEEPLPAEPANVAEGKMYKYSVAPFSGYAEVPSVDADVYHIGHLTDTYYDVAEPSRSSNCAAAPGSTGKNGYVGYISQVTDYTVIVDLGGKFDITGAKMDIFWDADNPFGSSAQPTRFDCAYSADGETWSSETDIKDNYDARPVLHSDTTASTRTAKTHKCEVAGTGVQYVRFTISILGDTGQNRLYMDEIEVWGVPAE